MPRLLPVDRDRTARPGSAPASPTAAEVLEDRRLLTFYRVTTLEDVVADDGQVSLREAVSAAGMNTAVNEAAAGSAGGTDRIRIDPAAVSHGDGVIALNDALQVRGSLQLLATGATFEGGGTKLNIELSAGERVEVDSAIFRGADDTNDDTAVRFTAAGDDAALVFRRSRFESHGRNDPTETGGGPGALLQDGGRVLLDRTVFTNNANVCPNDCPYEGGAVRTDAGRLIVRDSFFGGNTAQGGGAAIAFSDENSTLTVERTRFDDHFGGAVLVRGTLVMRDSRIAGVRGGTISTAPAAVDVRGDALIEGTVIRDAAADNASFVSTTGAAIAHQGGTLRVENSRILNNSTFGLGGGIGVRDGRAFIVDSEIRGNTVTADRDSNFGRDDETGLGGGLHAEGAQIGLRNVLFAENNAEQAGGAIYLEDGATLVDRGSRFVGNSAVAGGAIASLTGLGRDGFRDDSPNPDGNGPVVLRSTRFEDNFTADPGEPDGSFPVEFEYASPVRLAFGDGGALLFRGGQGGVVLDGVRMTGNQARRDGGAVASEDVSVFATNLFARDNSAVRNGGAVAVGTSGGYRANDSRFLVNTAASGGAVHTAGGAFALRGGQIRQNAASLEGGGVFYAAGRPLLESVELTRNTAAGDGGAIYNAADAGLFDATVTGNVAGFGTGEGTGGGVFTASGARTRLAVTTDVFGNRPDDLGGTGRVQMV